MNTEKICLGFRAGQCFQMKDKKEKPFGDHHAAWSWEGSLRSSSCFATWIFLPIANSSAPPRCSCNCQAKVIVLLWTQWSCEWFPTHKSKLAAYLHISHGAHAAAMCPPLWRLQKPDPLGLPASRPSRIRSLPLNRECEVAETNGTKHQPLTPGKGGSAPNDSIVFAWLSQR